MIVTDTSALVSLATIDLLETLLVEFDVHTTEQVIAELETTSEYDDRHGTAATAVLESKGRIAVHELDGTLESSRVDQGEGSCALLTDEIDAEFLITDDLRALPELQTVAEAQVAISPIVCRALQKRGVLERDEALAKVDDLARRRDWLGAPIYRRAKQLFEE